LPAEYKKVLRKNEPADPESSGNLMPAAVRIHNRPDFAPHRNNQHLSDPVPVEGGSFC